jgi:glucose/arabinose dehydrogenase
MRDGVIGMVMLMASVGFATPSRGADADVDAGRAVFRERCALCHVADPRDGGGAQGPSLVGVFGRHAAADPRWSYSRALSAANLTWDAATLNRFLAAPATLVPGTTMAVAVPEGAVRGQLVAYFQSVAHAVAALVPQVVPAGEADWRQDHPGRTHHIDAAALPAPFATESHRNPPKMVQAPPNARLEVPPGFRVEVFARDLAGPRKMLVAANGDVLVSETTGGRVTVLRPSADAAKIAARGVFAAGLKQPFGLAFYPDAAHPQWLYVAETNRIVRYAYATGDLVARGGPQIVVPSLPEGGGHFTRDLVFSPEGTRFYVSVGSGSNVAEAMPKKSVVDAKRWDETYTLGAAWGKETNRADVLVFSTDQPTGIAIYATGLRNCVGLTRRPGSPDLWCTVNERDGLGDDLVPDYSTHLEQGLFYGWPWYYLGSHEDPRLAGERPDLRGQVTAPDVLYQAHSAPLDLEFYVATRGCSAFPAEYVGDAFVTFHGSWNRAFRTGHKLVRMRMQQGHATGTYEDFLTGFIVDDGDAWGRPVASVELADGSLLMSDDGANVIYRISYGTACAARGGAG